MYVGSVQTSEEGAVASLALSVLASGLITIPPLDIPNAHTRIMSYYTIKKDGSAGRILKRHEHTGNNIDHQLCVSCSIREGKFQTG